MIVWGVVPAAGMGRRMGDGDPKQYREVCGSPILVLTLEALFSSGIVDGITVAVAEDYMDRARRTIADRWGNDALITYVAGGATRQESVRRALISIEGKGVDYVVIHDAARPLVDVETIRAAVTAATRHGAAVAAVPATEASCLVDGEMITEYIDRRRHVTIQTPQAFRYDLIMKAHEAAAAAGITNAVDDGVLMLRLGSRVALTPGGTENIKITYEDDLRLVDRVVKG